MRILFVSALPASPDQARKYQELRVQNDIATLQHAAQLSGGHHIDFVFRPDMTIGELPIALAQLQPDILHISTHGDTEALSLTNEEGRAVPVSASTLGYMLSNATPPRLLILSACNSVAIASELSKVVDYCVGFTLPVSASQARASVVALYQAIFSGQSVDFAYKYAQSIFNDIRRGTVSIELKPKEGLNPALSVLCPIVELVAKFANNNIPKNIGPNSNIKIEFGVANCPASATQVVFFTNNRYWVESEEDVDADEMASIVVDEAWSSPGSKTLWSGVWPMPADFNMYACVLLGNSQSLLIRSSTRDALRRYYAKSRGLQLTRGERSELEAAIEEFCRPERHE